MGKKNHSLDTYNGRILLESVVVTFKLWYAQRWAISKCFHSDCKGPNILVAQRKFISFRKHTYFQSSFCKSEYIMKIKSSHGPSLNRNSLCHFTALYFALYFRGGWKESSLFAIRSCWRRNCMIIRENRFPSGDWKQWQVFLYMCF